MASRGLAGKAGGLALFGALVAAVAVLGGAASAGGTGAFYRSLRKPSFTPPAAVFGPVWTVLYAAIAVSGYRAWRAPPSRRRSVALGLWGTQLALNAAWSPLFFGLERPRAALVDIALLLPAAAGYAFVVHRVDRPAAWLVAPYVGWVAFATALNAEIVRLN